jgi:prevent-host-death family protein
LQTLTIEELKAHFSEVLEKVKEGQRVAISYGKKQEKVAMIIPYSSRFDRPERKLGLLSGQAICKIHDDFDVSDEEVLNS